MAANLISATPEKNPSAGKAISKLRRPTKLGQAVTKLSQVRLRSGFPPAQSLA